MKRFPSILLCSLLLIAGFFAYRYFALETQNDSWNEAWYRPHEMTEPVDKPICEVEIPIYDNDTGDGNSKVGYLFYHIGAAALLPTDIMPGKRQSHNKDMIKLGYQKECPTVFNYFLLHDLYSNRLIEDFFQYNQNFEKQSSAIEPSANQCELTISMPHIYEDIEIRLNQYLKLHLKSFQGIHSIKPINGYAVSVQLKFYSACDQVLADYLMQDLMPADYFQMT
ncbi:hypothetical protein AAEX37_00830 [Oligella sp. MSHR50489EDL]|uniref:hypothetical protein n=1 Tax=Oligella sp. MSHR50489EDL TaxID=3139409 RepID=UPI003D813ABF